MALASAVFALGQSHPSWWTLASPDATALVGIHWENVKQSVFAEPISAELASTGTLGFPDLPCLKDAKQILISSPALLAIATGTFDAKTVSVQAVAAHMKVGVYNNVVMWISPGKTLSMALLSNQLILIGSKKTLEEAVDRNAAETDRHYSPLLARAARYQAKDLWVIAAQLPDPLASLFAPIETETKSFEGSLSLSDGLHVEATVDAGSEDAAATVGETLRGSIPSLPAVAHDLQVTVDGEHVLLALDASNQQVVSGLRQTFVQHEPDTSQPSEPVTLQQITPQQIEQKMDLPAPPAAIPVPSFEPPKLGETAKPGEPAKLNDNPAKAVGAQIIRIFGLDEGPREVVLPPPPKQQF